MSPAVFKTVYARSEDRVGGFDSHTLPPSRPSPIPSLLPHRRPLPIDALCRATRLARRPVLLAVFSALGAVPVSAQVGVESDSTRVRPGLPPAPAVSPGGAFLRSLALPAWGHAAVGSGRGAFYTFAEAGSTWMFLRVRSRVSSARGTLEIRQAAARAEAEAAGLTDEGEIVTAIQQDEGVQDAIALVDAREGQREDWVALMIFSVLLSGVDAYVSAHLQGFPDPISSGIRTSPWGGIEVVGQLRLPLGW